ncbi:sensor domain-containing diguanylate cyclase [Paenisporosarcina cavernae]|uniref:Sensor domain-containing diguanylate cyclase n=1 Tax=Paenisporosarcina cavernae TaxID=2320858 RepID=A0A385YPT2_9BACL|nr:sensor domain-containing diguanylate cyclase [Paenisporosarcina cavernae]AYC28606.1 sensor domain-containing diguanylate cyclase [Paenisporosarcina cavernae]
MPERRIGQLGQDSKIILDAVKEGIYGMDFSGKIIFCNVAAAEMLGYSQEELIGQHAHDLIHHSKKDGSVYPIDECSTTKTLEDGMARTIEDEVFWNKAGEPVSVEYSVSPILVDGKIIGAVTACRDITERLKSEDFIHGQKRLLEMIAHGDATETVLLEMLRLLVAHTNAIQAKLQIGDETFQLSSETAEPLVETSILHVPIKEAAEEDSGMLYIEFSEQAGPSILDAEIAETYVKLVILAIERKKYEIAVAQLAFEDDLTGLANRRQFEEKLQLALSKAKKSGKEIGLLFMDVDAFKSINDTYGHHIGDAVLQQLASRIQACVNEPNLFARFGGDEFMLLIQHANVQQAIDEFKTSLYQVLKHSFQLEDLQLDLSLSIGYSIYPRDGEDIFTLMKRADKQMYNMKRLHKKSQIGYEI